MEGKALYVIVLTFLAFAWDIAFNDGAVLHWLAALLGVN